MNKEIRGQAQKITDEITDKLFYYMRYKMGVWLKEADIGEFNRIIKSIIVQHNIRGTFHGEGN